MSTVYISDLDGTLLNSQGRLSEFTASELQQLLFEGADFSVASARSVVTIKSVMPGISLHLPVVEFNGAFISDLATGYHHVINDIDRAVVDDLYQDMLDSGCEPFVSTYDGKRDHLYCPQACNEGMQWYIDERLAYRDERLSENPDLRAVLSEQVICLTSIGRRPELETAEQKINEKYGSVVETHLFENHYSPTWYWLTVHDRRASKDRGIRTLLEMTGLHGRELMVFGDHVNDLKMFSLADHAIAVGNAVDDLKSLASRVIGTNDEDSVIRYIREHLGRKGAV